MISYNATGDIFSNIKSALLLVSPFISIPINRIEILTADIAAVPDQ